MEPKVARNINNWSCLRCVLSESTSYEHLPTWRLATSRYRQLDLRTYVR